MNSTELPSTSLLLKISAVAIEAAKAAGDAMKNVRSTHAENTSSKSDGSQLTAGDLAAQHAIISILNREFPTHTILSEEMTEAEQQATLNAENLWILDPIDGTTNYAYGMNRTCTSIAYTNRGRSCVGVVFNPFDDELFTAVRGHGAFLNGKKIAVRSDPVTSLSQVLVTTGFSASPSKRTDAITRVSRVLSHCRDLRRLGACALDLCDVACGRVDAFYETVNSWDMAAGGLIAREAGAELICFKTGASVEIEGDDLLCSRSEVTRLIAPILKG